MCIVASIGTVSAKGFVTESSVTAQGQRYNVVVTYSISYTYIDKETNQVLAEGQRRSTGTQTFVIYAESKNEAEEQAKLECNTVCTRNSRYVGDATYNGKKCEVYEYRRVETARAI